MSAGLASTESGSPSNWELNIETAISDWTAENCMSETACAERCKFVIDVVVNFISSTSAKLSDSISSALTWQGARSETFFTSMPASTKIFLLSTLTIGKWDSPASALTLVPKKR